MKPKQSVKEWIEEKITAGFRQLVLSESRDVGNLSDDEWIFKSIMYPAIADTICEIVERRKRDLPGRLYHLRASKPGSLVEERMSFFFEGSRNTRNRRIRMGTLEKIKRQRRQ